MWEPFSGLGADLDQQIRAARRKLGGSITSAARLTPAHVMVWGQFADAPARALQTGVYGTSTAAMLLAARGRDMTSTVRLLPGVTEPSSAEFDVSDLLITHKASAVVEALSAVRYPGAHATAACLTLLSGVIDRQGWGHHAVPGEPEMPSVLATSHALIALAGIEGIDESLLEGPALWLSGRILDDGLLGTLELAFAVIALAKLRTAGIGPEGSEALRRGANVLRATLRRMSADSIVYEQVHYWVPKPGEQRNHYMTFPLQVVVGTALLESGAGARARSSLRELAGRLCRAVEADGGLRSSLTERIGVVDAGLVDRFFAVYLAAQPAPRWRRRMFLRLARVRWLPRTLVFLGLVVVAFWTWRVASGESGGMSAASVANIVFALVTGVLGSMAYSRWDRR
ncbi:hypothetical protein [Promicromonospora kroppenstedtii]|uniref:hypothetical protein n=1 Tax=Promicromonospora kroppenstedtii TaxID=440482 RepID=UPI0005655830|nr:hypothetical protein [Promicromonospora kroppenstedtii]